MFWSRSRKWRKFKRLAEAMKFAAAKGRRVTRDVEVEGIAFDASVEYVNPPCVYKILVKIVESETPLAFDDLRTIVGEFHTANSHFGLVLSESGFEGECSRIYEVDQSIRLLTAEGLYTTEIDELAKLFDPVLDFYDFHFLTPTGPPIGIPDEPGVLKSFLQDIRVETNGESLSPEEILDRVKAEIYESASGTHKTLLFSLGPNAQMLHPNIRTRTPVTDFAFAYGLFLQVELEDDPAKNGPYRIDGMIEDELRKRNPAVSLADLDARKGVALLVNRYYFNPNLLFSYYCQAVNKGGSATMMLVESYQFGTLMQATFEVPKEGKTQFVEITDPDEIARLAKLYDKYSVSARNLTSRFEAYLNSLDTAECIDEIELTPQQTKANRADYFLNSRSVVCELKSLESDASEKIQKVLQEYQSRPEWPIVMGTRGLQSVLRDFADKDEINRRLVDAASDSIERLVEKANKQIRVTKETFGLSSSSGLVVLLNDIVISLPPDVIVYRVNKALQKKAEGGKEPRFPFISAVLIVSTAHITEVEPDRQAMPLLAIENPLAAVPLEYEYVDQIMRGWSKFEGLPFIEGNVDFRKTKFRPNLDPRAQKGKGRTKRE